jgi:SAM-dependent methyltransferase
MSLDRIAKLPLLGPVLRRLARWRAREKVAPISAYLQPTDSVLDIGSGNGVLCAALRDRGHNVTALDVRDASFTPAVRPIVYDGARLPFRDKAFDIALLITILHHTRDPERVVAEAQRVANKVIVIEEIFTNLVNRYVTYFIDSLFNAEFFGHPHTNKTDAEWRELFDRRGFRVVHVSYSRSILFLRRVTYVLEQEALERGQRPETPLAVLTGGPVITTAGSQAEID